MAFDRRIFNPELKGKRLALAMLAGARAIESNRLCDMTTYCLDPFGENGGPFELSCYAAAEMLRAQGVELLEMDKARRGVSNENRLIDGNGSFTLNECNGDGHSLCFGNGIIDVYDRNGKCLCQFKAEDAPAVSAVRVVHGRWTRTGMHLLPYECSACGSKEDGRTAYCPNCGATMDGGLHG